MKILRKKVKILDEIKEQVELIADEGYVITTKEKPEEGEDQIYSPHLFLSFSSAFFLPLYYNHTLLLHTVHLDGACLWQFHTTYESRLVHGRQRIKVLAV